MSPGDDDHRLSADDLAVDRELADIALGYRFLLDVTPTDLGDARRRFLDDGEPPRFAYRPLEDDVTVIANRLDKVTGEHVGDATLAHLVEAKQREVALQLEMLRCRGSAEFLPLSVELYGAVTPSLLATAEQLLDRLDPAPAAAGQALDAATFAQRARDELDRYAEVFPELDVRVEIRDDVPGVMFIHDRLLVASSTTVPTARVDALLQHEVGTHVVTYVNGSRQPLRLLAAGLAGYDETQEGLAVLAEHLVGGLTPRRLRQLAARVVAVHRMTSGAAFADVHGELVRAGLHPGPAFSVTARVFRAGGLTKDAIYLRGLVDVLAHLRDPGDVDVLWLGKMALADAPLVQDLRDRGVLRAPTLRPRYLDDPAARERLRRVGATTTLHDLIGDPT